jgi:hypothetical protein
MKIPINIIPSHKIDAVKWDVCVAANNGGLIYAQYHYLNTICSNWSAVVFGNYQAILPLPWRKKFGITYFYAPAFMQQLGLIGQIEGLSSKQLFTSIRSIAKLGDLFFNYTNEWVFTKHNYILKNNYTIKLAQDYLSIASKYSKDLIQNLQKAEKTNYQYLTDTAISNTISLFQSQYGNRFKQITPTDFTNFERICLQLQQNQQCYIRFIKDTSSEKKLATALLLKDQKRLYLVMNSTSNEGRKASANHLLIDRILHEFSGQNLIFDFEGSNLDGVKTFYKNYHPENQPYFHLQVGMLTKLKQLVIAPESNF